MNIQVIDVVVFLIATAQILIVLLNWNRDREIRRLQAHLDQQQLLLSEITGWLKRDMVARSRQNKPDRGSLPKDQSSSTEDEPARASKAGTWSREIFADLRAGLKGDAPAEPVSRADDSPEKIAPVTTEAEVKGTTKPFKWFKEDANEPREIAEAREIIAGLKKNAPQGPASAAKDPTDVTRAGSTEEELERLNKATNWLKEDRDKAVASFQQRTEPTKKIG